MEIGLINRVNIEEEMQQAYLDYAMSVIVARALPDARDGLKPVHRRILYAMHDMGLRTDSAYKKSARIVGEVLGKYHPHGDMSVYEAMARMAQSFSMRYMLVDGQGNFGSIDGDSPAAMRYTEARLSEMAISILKDIQKNTVDFDQNFDGTLTEPKVLPAAIPNLLVNGATGIAVGMATSIPPHNLSEITAGAHYMLENWDQMDDITVEDLMNFIPGPDFPTGGIILQDEAGTGLTSAYSTGRGAVTVRASAHLEEMERGRSRIIINELPYMTNKSSLIERIANLVREERLDGIADLRDESDRQGMRIVIELSKTADPESVLSSLFKSTPMQSTFSIIILALVDGEPRLLSLKQCLRVFLEHRLTIVRRRTEYDLERARQRVHILEGYQIALKNLDEIISLIRKAPDAETARERLIKRFRLTIIQAQAILDLQLRRLAALERKKIEEEYRDILAQIKDLEALLRSPKLMRQVVDQELQAANESFGDRRRTHIARVKAESGKVSMLTATDLKPEKLGWVSVTPKGLISRSLSEQPPRLSGKDAPGWLIQANTRDTLFLVSEQGEAAAIAVHSLPETNEPAAGIPINKISPLKLEQSLAAIFCLPPKERRSDPKSASPSSEDGFEYIVSISHEGMVKKSSISELPGPSANVFTLAKINSNDRLHKILLTSGKDDLLLVSEQGMAIRFSEEEVRPMGLPAAGVQGIKLQTSDAIAGAEVLPRTGEVFLLASDGSAKRVPVEQFSRQGRYGFGLIAWKLPAKVRVVGVAAGKGTTRITVHLTRLAAKSIRLDDAPVLGRTARGQPVAEIKSDDPVTRICVPIETKRKESRSAGRSVAKPKSTMKPVNKPSTTTSKPSGKIALPAKKILTTPAAKTSKPADPSISKTQTTPKQTSKTTAAPKPKTPAPKRKSTAAKPTEPENKATGAQPAKPSASPKARAKPTS